MGGSVKACPQPKEAQFPALWSHSYLKSPVHSRKSVEALEGQEECGPVLLKHEHMSESPGRLFETLKAGSHPQSV